MLEYIKPISDGSHRRCMVLINGIQLYCDLLTRLPFQKMKSNHWSILLFLHGCKQRRTWRLATAIKTKLLVNLSEILTVIVWKMTLNNGIHILHQWCHQSINTGTYQTALVQFRQKLHSALTLANFVRLTSKFGRFVFLSTFLKLRNIKLII